MDNYETRALHFVSKSVDDIQNLVLSIDNKASVSVDEWAASNKLKLILEDLYAARMALVKTVGSSGGRL